MRRAAAPNIAARTPPATTVGAAAAPVNLAVEVAADDFPAETEEVPIAFEADDELVGFKVTVTG
jgi:hypothetical protein